jgi:hypothetical protein
MRAVRPRAQLRAASLLAAVSAVIALAGAPSSSAHLPTAKGGLDLTRLALGDGKASTAPARGFIHACRTSSGGSAPSGPWIEGSYWDFTAKPTVSGRVDHPSRYDEEVGAGVRRIETNNLPSHPAGNYPIASSDDAYQYDPMNQAGVAAQTVVVELPARPKRSGSSCVGGEVGVMKSGVVLNNGFDANGFDAPAHEMQDDCSGHPHAPDFYHYHSLPLCINSGKDGRHSKLIGWALDGFPIAGPLGDDGEYMKNNDLDACHGHTHKLRVDGRKRRTYHYPATQQFPYTVGCYRGTPVTTGPLVPPRILP